MEKISLKQQTTALVEESKEVMDMVIGANVTTETLSYMDDDTAKMLLKSITLYEKAMRLAVAQAEALDNIQNDLEEIKKAIKH